MSPTYTMSAHLCKQIYKSFQTRQTSPEPLSSPTTTTYTSTYLRRSPSPTPEKRSMDSDRGDSTAHSTSPPSSSGWKWGGR
ncbi:uncharacterized protein GGS22DRAFT_161759 [Annulohypoxylon maeteangense]|uniref:uncharacterized protein n=1 Tax=Annulohypoxylon maeteangense TaxID=1927788 RepID=UPI00200826D4|nr:uncharacterized protein GGS22DRAFT_161759 [Annulohypoxylon maeteangense]KAI0885733.1 hypothetical protein GGS22DRAFT_161759 [Annulohypoxylon maeteangense]